MSENGNKSNWSDWSQHVLKELERLHESINQLDKKVENLKDTRINKLERDMEVLKTKLLVISSISAVVVSLVVTVVSKYL